MNSAPSLVPVVPVLHISSGRVVQWDSSGRSIRRDPAANPLYLMLTLAEQGIELIHIIDLDAVAGRPSTVPALMMGLRRRPLTIRLAGGIHDVSTARNRKAFGIHEIVVSTAFYSSSTLQQIFSVFPPEQILVGMYCSDGQLSVNGEPDSFEFLVERMQNFGLHRVVINSRYPESVASLANRQVISQLASKGFEVWVGGSVQSDVEAGLLKDDGAAGVLVDRAYPLDH